MKPRTYKRGKDVEDDLVSRTINETSFLHPADEPTVLRDIAKRCSNYADKCEDRNDREGVPDRLPFKIHIHRHGEQGGQE